MLTTQPAKVETKEKSRPVDGSAQQIVVVLVLKLVRWTGTYGRKPRLEVTYLSRLRSIGLR